MVIGEDSVTRVMSAEEMTQNGEKNVYCVGIWKLEKNTTPTMRSSVVDQGHVSVYVVLM